HGPSLRHQTDSLRSECARPHHYADRRPTHLLRGPWHMDGLPLFQASLARFAPGDDRRIAQRRAWLHARSARSFGVVSKGTRARLYGPAVVRARSFLSRRGRAGVVVQSAAFSHFRIVYPSGLAGLFTTAPRRTDQSGAPIAIGLS